MRDLDVRKALLRKLDFDFSKDPNTRIVEEMGIWSGSVRIDVAVINGKLSGYELKSDRDTLNRLPDQSRLYNHVFDHLTLIVGKRHLEKAIEFIPKWWGLSLAVECSNGICLIDFRESQKNPSPDPYLIAQLLWKAEALKILDGLGLAKGWQRKPVRIIHERLASQLSIEQLSKYVREALKQRRDWLGQHISNNGEMPIYTDFNPSSPAPACNCS